MATATPTDGSVRLLTKPVKGVRCLVVTGDLDAKRAGEMEGLLGELASGSRVVIDLSKASFMDSAGMTALLALHSWLVDVGGSLDVVSPLGTVRRLIASAGMSRVLACHGTRAEAVESALRR